MTFSLMDRGPFPADRSGASPEQFTKESILRDYRIAFESREASLVGEKQVFTGKAKFGIFGSGKEVPQVALARAFRAGDFRSGYYRDQTLMLALGLLTLDEFFAQLYATPDLALDPSSAGRSMTAHFATHLLNPDGSFRALADLVSSASDVSPTGAQMPRLVGLAYASRLYRELPELARFSQFSHHGDEIAFGTIGNASCAEGMFWEAVNAAGVLQVPMLLSIWDDGYGISVPNELQIAKGDLSAVLAGFRRAPGSRQGCDLYTVQGWDYAGLCETYLNAAQIVRREQVPAIVHVTELTQPQGHSTSGSHRRYKSAERLAWEEECDGLRKMRQWILEQGIATAAELEALEKEAIPRVRDAQERAWRAFAGPVEEERSFVLAVTEELARTAARPEQRAEVEAVRQELRKVQAPQRRDVMAALHASLAATCSPGSGIEELPAARRLIEWKREQDRLNADRYNSDLYSTTPEAALHIPEVKAVYAPGAPEKNGFEILNLCFDHALRRFPNLIALGEDVGQIGDVNQGFAGLQAKYGPLRVSDTGIREATIMGQAIGMALRGLRPIAEIQYLDYMLYALQILSDDLASLRYRTKGRQKAPVIVRTRGHRLEGIWHSGSPMAGIIHLVRGLYVCVPRNMTQAAGFYNLLLRADDPAIVVEVLNGYRLKEKLPSNLGDFTVPLGVPEVLREGKDVTVVTYGACCRIALEAAEKLARCGIEAEVVDVQTLLPFDRHARIAESLRKTNRVLFLDEDVPGGASAFMFQQVLEVQGGYAWLDGAPRTLAAKEHRPAYGSDGDYWSKPNRETVFEAVYEMMHEAKPAKFPIFWK
ncbi:MAG TPA: transketolase C-terminal domain-containing protein [Thermoanaerobaculia bacterium]|jgi:pyruvate/2-oxoglutarate/acetoin dehydrogenase E1 component/TPP-dependent pyruvate/acetoin dehydrogenase alpha subunit|nr:transketolase C-terminal domain-containing protein [Thermoanaerobaculia bacterium]